VDTVPFESEILTLAFWVLADSANGNVLTCSSPSLPHFAVKMATGDLTAAIYGGAGGQLEETADFSAHTGRWTHVAAVFDNSTAGGDIKIYINGVLQAENKTIDTKAASGNFATQAIQIGEDFVPQFDGAMDDLRIDAGALSASQINTILTAAPTVITARNGYPILGLAGELIFAI
jgi:hypothetical protein